MLYASAVTAMVVAALGVVGGVWWRLRLRRRREIESYAIDAEELHSLLAPEPKVQVLDVRLPLDVLAYSEMIPGAKRIAPKEILADPTLIPAHIDTVVYCTCASEQTSREIIQRALGMGFRRVKLLRGGLEGWKAKGYPVEPYKESFRLDTVV